jgi:hypothetical protein
MQLVQARIGVPTYIHAYTHTHIYRYMHKFVPTYMQVIDAAPATHIHTYIHILLPTYTQVIDAARSGSHRGIVACERILQESPELVEAFVECGKDLACMCMCVCMYFARVT